MMIINLYIILLPKEKEKKKSHENSEPIGFLNDTIVYARLALAMACGLPSWEP